VEKMVLVDLVIQVDQVEVEQELVEHLDQEILLLVSPSQGNNGGKVQILQVYGGGAGGGALAVGSNRYTSPYSFFRIWWSMVVEVVFQHVWNFNGQSPFTARAGGGGGGTFICLGFITTNRLWTRRLVVMAVQE
jgi:hypothetical protein